MLNELRVTAANMSVGLDRVEGWATAHGPGGCAVAKRIAPDVRSMKDSSLPGAERCANGSEASWLKAL